MSFEAVPAAPTATATPTMDPISAGLAESLRELIYTGQQTSARSLQAEVGMSEVGGICERELGYKINGTPPVNFDTDPLASLIGQGTHHELAELVGRQNHAGRWLIEAPVSYKGRPGTLDLYDRRRKILIDWKTTSKSKLRTLRNEGPPQGYQVQIQAYAAALQSQGLEVLRVALAFLPRDGTLADLWVWTTPVEQVIADEAIARYERVAATPLLELRATPSRLCGWCNFHQPGSTDITRGCPGQNNQPTKKG